MSIWHCDRLHQPSVTLDIGFIKDESNLEAPHIWPRIEGPPLSQKLAETWELAQGAAFSKPENVDPTPASFFTCRHQGPKLFEIYTNIRGIGSSSSSLEDGGSYGHSSSPHSTLDAKIHC